MQRTQSLTVFVLVLVGTIAASARASATPLVVGSQVTLYDGPGNNGGGEFYADVLPFGTPYDFITFCLQYNEHFTPGVAMYIGGVTDHTSTGTNPALDDPLSVQTAFLYTSFRNGTLPNYAFSGPITYNGTTYDRTGTATALQLAFWFLENEVSRNPTTGVFTDAYGYGANFGPNALADYYINLPKGSWQGLGNVRVLNLFSSYDPRNGFSGNLQDQIALDDEVTRIATPEPGSLALLGIGLAGTIAKLRRRRQR